MARPVHERTVVYQHSFQDGKPAPAIRERWRVRAQQIGDHHLVESSWRCGELPWHTDFVVGGLLQDEAEQLVAIMIGSRLREDYTEEGTPPLNEQEAK